MKRNIQLICSISLMVLLVQLFSCMSSGEPVIIKDVFTIHVGSDSTGSVIDTGAHQVPVFGAYELIASEPLPGYEFAYWKVISGEANLIITRKDSVRAMVTNIQGDAQIRAIFTKKQLPIKIIGIPSVAIDSIQLDPQPLSTGMYEYGTSVNVIIDKATGWKIDGWSRSEYSKKDTAVFTVDQETIDTVYFSPIQVPENVICVKHDAPQNGGGKIGSN